MILTAYEIWKAVHWTMASQLEEKHGFETMTKFILLEESNEIVASLHKRINELENR